MRNFANFDGGKNIPGYVHFYFIEDSALSFIPFENDGVIDLDSIEYVEGNQWNAGAAILHTLQLGNEQKQTEAGPVYPVLIEGRAAFKSAHNLKLFHEMSFKRFVVLIKDKNGNMFICGEVNNGLTFSWKETEGGFSFVFGAAYKTPCWFATGEFAVDGTSYNIDYLPVNSYVQGQDGKSAYQIAVEGGFVGSEAAWLASLQGEDGEPGVAADEDFTTVAAFKFMYNY